jgi:DNA-binding IclR family transcriptional regulator
VASDVPAVGAAVRILDSLAAASPGAVSAGRLVNELKMNRSTCYNILAALEREGWASSLGGRAGWTLGPRLIALADRTGDLVSAIVQQELDSLSAEIGFVTFVSEWNSQGDHVVVAKAERQTGVRVTVGIGDTFPFSAPALLQVMCSWMEPSERERFFATHVIEEFTPNTVVDRTALEKLMGKVRREGYSTSLQQFNLAQGAVAAPVFDPRGHVHRAVCCLAFSSDLNDSNAHLVGNVVQDAAARITLRTGGVLPAVQEDGTAVVQHQTRESQQLHAGLTTTRAKSPTSPHL